MGPKSGNCNAIFPLLPYIANRQPRRYEPSMPETCAPTRYPSSLQSPRLNFSRRSPARFCTTFMHHSDLARSITRQSNAAGASGTTWTLADADACRAHPKLRTPLAGRATRRDGFLSPFVPIFLPTPCRTSRHAVFPRHDNCMPFRPYSPRPQLRFRIIIRLTDSRSFQYVH